MSDLAADAVTLEQVEDTAIILAAAGVCVHDMGLDPEQITRWLGTAYAARKQASDLIHALETLAIAALPIGDVVTVPGCGQLVIESRGRATNRGDVLALHLAGRVADTPADEDGVALPPGELCRRTAQECIEVFGLDLSSTRFRTGEVKARGMKPGAYRSYGDARPCVVFIDGASS